MKEALRLAAAIPWAIDPAWLTRILAIANREGPGPEAVSAQLGRPLDNAHDVTIRDRVAVIPVVGPVMRYASIFTAISGAVSVDMLARDLRMALDSDEVDAILLDVDSPGGEVNGIHELAEMIAAARANKPIAVYAGGTCASAAYWLASAAGDITIDATAIVGSIGVVMALPNPEAEKAEEIEIVSSNAPNKRPDVSTDEGRATVLATIDALAAVFTADVARHRGVTPEDVTKRFGGGGVFVGDDAVKAGLVDRTGSFEDALAALGARTSTAAPGAATTNNGSSTQEGRAMSLHAHAKNSMKTIASDPAEPAKDPAQEPAKDAPAKPEKKVAEAEPMKCEGCAATNAAGSKFCAQCGAAFPEKEDEDEPSSSMSSSGDGEDMGARALASITGQPTLSLALGVVHAWKHVATEDAPTLRAEVGKLQARIAQLEAASAVDAAEKAATDAKSQRKSSVDALIARARSEKKLGAGAYAVELEKKIRALGEKDLEMAAACVDGLPAHPALGQSTKEPAKVEGAVDGALVHEGKRFEQMTYKEQAALHQADPQLYARMVDDATKRNVLR